jgi:NADH:ubiquinone oxidoreductase subunit C
MTREELKLKLTELIPSASFDESGEFLNVDIAAGYFLPAAETIRNHPELNFDYLFCLTGIDFKTHLIMVYHLSSTTYRHELVVKSKLSRTNPEIESISHIWRTAEFHEREVYEMFGVNFLHHPDLRLLILPDGWEGKKPLLKDFEDPVNMIKL